jgi:hypothetical protein
MNIRQTSVQNMDPDHWLWCQRCERFFQAKDLRKDPIGRSEACAFEGCDGAGLRTEIFDWDAWANLNRADYWPKSTSDLVKGQKCPLNPQKRG